MKTTGVILLILGLLSLFGGIVHTSGADTEVVIFGYVLKFLLIIGGILLINSKKKKDFTSKSAVQIPLTETKKEIDQEAYVNDLIDLMKTNYKKTFTQDDSKTIIKIFELLLNTEVPNNFGNLETIGWLDLDKIIQQKVDLVQQEQGDNWGDFISLRFEIFGYEPLEYTYSFPYDDYFNERDFNFILEERNRYL